ncbi:hypothetical protein E2C01_055894 [Portunus trituberculatus]|uniref:RNase H type-1 domain-containing protein n=1 Tax=Portunus trituberculatus TaxID=210409 RepID=A0A5B7GXC9_PORTR|nr:hypothetical protein [Portunus trituberculatus]
MQFSATQLRHLVQNEVMKIILGCAKTARNEILRAELHLPSVICRIQKITCRTVGRMLSTGSDSLKGLLTPLYHDTWTPTTPYLRKILGVLTSVAWTVIWLKMSSSHPCLRSAGAIVHFTWIPSHVGILLYEKADRLAQCAFKTTQRILALSTL